MASVTVSDSRVAKLSLTNNTFAALSLRTPSGQRYCLVPESTADLDLPAVFCACCKMAAVAEPFDEFEVARQLFRDQPAGFPYEGFDIEELILPEDDDMGIKSDEDDGDDDEELENETGFGSVIGRLSLVAHWNL